MIEINRNPTRKELAVFALLLAVLVAVIGWWFGYGMLVASSPAIALLGLLSARFFPQGLRLLYLAWMYAAYPIGWLVSHTLILVIYFVVLTPIGICMRLVGRCPLDLTFERTASSYWTVRKPRASKATYYRQY